MISMFPLGLSPRAAARTYFLDQDSESVWRMMYVFHHCVFEPWLILLRQQTFNHQPDTSESLTFTPSSNQKFEKKVKISHPAVAFSGTLALGTPRPSLSRAVVGCGDERVPCHNNCGQTFTLPQDANRHCKHSCPLSANVTRFHCPKCPNSLSRKDSLCRHLVQVHGCTESDAKMLVEDVVTKRYR